MPIAALARSFSASPGRPIRCLPPNARSAQPDLPCPAWLRPAQDRARPWLPDTSPATDRSGQDRSEPANALSGSAAAAAAIRASSRAMKFSASGSCATSRRRKSAAPRLARARRRRRPVDSVRPPGRPRMILSGATSTVTSSEFGRIATPWIDSSSDSSTKSCCLMKPRTGDGAVTTIKVSPASGSTNRCTRPGSGQRHGDIGKRGIGRCCVSTIRGCGRRLHRIGEGQRPVRDAVCRAARERRHLRTVEPNADRLAPCPAAAG